MKIVVQDWEGEQTRKMVRGNHIKLLRLSAINSTGNVASVVDSSVPCILLKIVLYPDSICNEKEKKHIKNFVLEKIFRIISLNSQKYARVPYSVSDWTSEAKWGNNEREKSTTHFNNSRRRSKTQLFLILSVILSFCLCRVEVQTQKNKRHKNKSRANENKRTEKA